MHLSGQGKLRNSKKYIWQFPCQMPGSSVFMPEQHKIDIEKTGERRKYIYSSTKIYGIILSDICIMEGVQVFDILRERCR